MLDLAIDNIEGVAFGLALLVPGAVILFVRSLFLTGRRRPHSEQAFGYAVVTLAYFAVAFPIFLWCLSDNPSDVRQWLAWVSLILIAPFLLGLLVGWIYQSGVGSYAVRLFGLEMIHPIPTAWDWKFGQRNESWIIVKLKDGTIFHCYFGNRSFASSDEERDIYAEAIFDRDESGRWIPMNQGLWVPASEISTIEFLPVDR